MCNNIHDRKNSTKLVTSATSKGTIIEADNTKTFRNSTLKLNKNGVNIMKSPKVFQINVSNQLIEKTYGNYLN